MSCEWANNVILNDFVLEHLIRSFYHIGLHIEHIVVLPQRTQSGFTKDTKRRVDHTFPVIWPNAAAVRGSFDPALFPEKYT